jgi:hypothetical protein
MKTIDNKIFRQVKRTNQLAYGICEHFEVKLQCSISIIFNISGVQSAGWLDIHFTVGTSCERAAPLAEKNASARHHVLRSLISLHNEHRVVSVEYYLLRLLASFFREKVFLGESYIAFRRAYLLQNRSLSWKQQSAYFYEVQRGDKVAVLEKGADSMVEEGYVIWQNLYSPPALKYGNCIWGSSVNEENSTRLQHAH